MLVPMVSVLKDVFDILLAAGPSAADAEDESDVFFSRPCSTQAIRILTLDSHLEY